MDATITPAVATIPERQPIAQVVNYTAPISSPVVNVAPPNHALTPEQIAQYVSKQRDLAQQHAKTQLSRPRAITVPARGLQ
jgi:hypothetical protein